MTTHPKQKTKTAIRQLIEYLEYRVSLINEHTSSIENINKLAIVMDTLKKARLLEPVNEQQIIDAVNHTNGSDDDPDLGQDYFLQTFEKP